MIEVSESLNTYLKRKGRTFKGRIETGNETLYEGIMSISVDRSVCADTFSFGNVNIGFCNIALYDVSEVFAGKEICVSLLPCNGSNYWIKIGTFHAEKPTISGKVTTFTAYDCIKYKTDGTYFPSTTETNVLVSDVYSDICLQCGCTFVPIASELYINPQLLSGYKLRDALGQIAGFLGGNILADNEGRITVRFFSDCDYEADENVISVPEIGEDNAVFDGILCKSSDKTLVSGSETGNLITFSNLLMTQEQLDIIWQSVKDITYNAVSVEILVGSPLLEVGDIFTLKVFENTYKVPLMHYTIDFDGGIMNTCESFYKTPEEDKSHPSASEKIKELEDDVESVKLGNGTNAEFINLVNSALGLYFSKQTLVDGSLKCYGHNQPSLAESTYIFTINSEGFAFVKGENCWNNGNPLWEYGITGDGNAILNYLIANKISADIIEAGAVKSVDGSILIDLNENLIRTSKYFDENDSSYVDDGIKKMETVFSVGEMTTKLEEVATETKHLISSNASGVTFIRYLKNVLNIDFFGGLLYIKNTEGNWKLALVADAGAVTELSVVDLMLTNPLPVEFGGTGASDAAQAIANLEITPKKISAVAVENEMTGAAGDYHEFAVAWSGNNVLFKIDDTVKTLLTATDKTAWTNSAFTLADEVIAATEVRANKYAQTVHLVGRVSCTSPADLYSTVNLGTLAEGYRPPRAFYKLVPAKAGRMAKIYVNTNGIVRLDAVYNFGSNSMEYSKEQSWISLDIDFGV